MKKKYILITTILLLVSVIVTACGGKTAGKTGDKAPDKILVTEAFHTLLYLPLYVAKDKGFFEQNQIDVTSIKAAGSGPTALASVLSGEAKFSIHGPEHVAFAKEKGGEARALSAVANGAPVWVLAKKGITINSPQDFKGKTVITGLAPSTHNTLFRKLMLDNNIDIGKDLTVKEVQNNSELGPVLAGQADIAVVYEPLASQGIAQGLNLVFDFTKVYPEFAFSTVNTSVKTIKENPDLVKRFIKAMDMALEYIHKDPAGAKEVAKREFPNMDPAVVESAVQRMIDSNVYLSKGLITEEAYKNAMEVQKFIGHVKKDIPFTEMVDPSFTK
jgi:NitT/TauT family transport system substrate-binding protein